MMPERRKILVRRVRWFSLWAGIALIVALVSIELIAQLGFGLCDPPLLKPDADFEYSFAPSQHCRQFGNDIEFNSYSMRAPEFPAKKASPEEFRVMVLGDSVVYGGTKVDQTEIATSRLRVSLAQRLKRPVVVGNIAAGSWGPQNLLGYTRRHGFFDADVLVIVLSSHDYGDTMTFGIQFDVHPDFLTKKPLLALPMIATRYLPRYLAIRNQARTPQRLPTTAPVQNIEASMTALRELFSTAREAGVGRIILLQHFEKPELDGPLMPGHDVILATAESSPGVAIVQLGPIMKAERARGEEPYIDFIHPSPAGHAIIARVIEDTIFAVPDTQSTR
jgi:hypothetical protein